MIKTLHRVKFETVTLLTLTYGHDWNKDPRQWKQNLKEFRRRFNREFTLLRAIWRLEFQKRGAPHFHLLVFDYPFIDLDRVQTIWYDILKTPPSQRYGNAVDVKHVKGDGNKSLIMSYVSKYVAKTSGPSAGEIPSSVGRVWGYWDIVEEDPIECEIWDYEAVDIAGQVMSMWSKHYYTPEDLTLGSLFGEELGTGNFQATVKKIVLSVSERKRGKFGKKVTFVTTNSSDKSS